MATTEQPSWHSPRFWEQEHHSEMVRIFDSFIDLALEGTITLEQAILGCKEVLQTAEEIDS